MRISRVLAALMISTATMLAACNSGSASVRVVLQWVPQAQFAGVFAAQKLGYYTDEGLTLEIVNGGPNVAPQVEGSKSNGPEFAISWVPKVLQARESAAKSDLVDIAQIFQRAATLSVSWKDANITKVADFAGKKVGAWGFGDELEVVASAKLQGMTDGTDYTRVEQPFDMSLLINAQKGCAKDATNCVDVAEAMVYNEWAQLLETTNPDTGQLFTADQFNVIDYNVVGTAMLQDAIFARASWLAEGNNKDTATKFLKATFKGWVYCRDHATECVQIVLDAGTALGKGHQTWQLNEINALIWPSPNGIGMLDSKAWDQMVKTALAGDILKAAPSADAYRTDLAKAALDALGSSVDTKGTGYTKATVQITKGGE